MAGDFKLINHAFFTLVTDHRKGYSNLEFVMKPFDQLAGTAEQANAALDVRLAAMKALYDEIYSKVGPTAISSLPGYGNTLTNPHDPHTAPDDHALAGGAKIDPTVADYHKKGAKEDGKIMVHYTIGFPIAALHDAMGLVETGGYNVGAARPKTHAGGAREAADAVVAKLQPRLDPGDIDEVKGAVALLYSQVAAFADSVGSQQTPQGKQAYQGGQIKNKAALLSRVNLSDIFNELPEAAKRVLKTTKARNDVIEIIADVLESSGELDFGDNDTRQLQGLPPTTLVNYTKSAMGGPAVDQQQVFGGMNLTGMDHDGEGGAKVPVEMRSMFGQFRTWDEFVADAKRLVAESRRIIEASGAAVAAVPSAYQGGASGSKRKVV
jgi:hypothetical protein